jgi:multidrug efflux pump subunit AcrA (membrane-fusion protein)
VPGSSTETRITVPARALVERGGLTGVFVVKEGRARLRWVSRGAAVGDAVEIRAGLEAGERVVLDPAGLEEGEEITVEPDRLGEGGVTPPPPARP